MLWLRFFFRAISNIMYDSSELGSKPLYFRVKILLQFDYGVFAARDSHIVGILVQSGEHTPMRLRRCGDSCWTHRLSWYVWI